MIMADPSGSLPNTTVNPSTSISVPLTVNSLVNLEGMDIWIMYNPNFLTATSAVLEGGILENQSYGLQVGLLSPGFVKLIFFANQNLFSGSGVVAYINLSVIGSAGSSSPLTFTKFDINETNFLSNTTNGCIVIQNTTQSADYLFEDAIPNVYALYQNFPNPFNNITTISYDLPERGYVLMTIYNIEGQVASILKNESESPGRKQLKWDAPDLSSGVYFYQLSVMTSNTTRSFLKTNKLLLLK